MVSSLLATKFHRPSAPPKQVVRPHLVQRLNEGLAAGCRITLVSAPAGFGKSTCIAEWANTLERWPVSWLSLDPADDEPGRFLTYLVAALQKIDSGLGREIQGMLHLPGGQLPSAELISTSLINSILESPVRLLLVLDDLHLIHDRFVLQILERLVASLPPLLHLVLLTREDPPLPLARLRANGQLTEIRAADLRFSVHEADRFLREVMGLALAETDVVALAERTEGWIVGLQLAGLSLRDRANSSAFVASLSGSHRFILNYLTEQVLDRQQEDIQSFLLQTSILDSMSGDLCDAVTGRTESAGLLESLLAANLFLIPLDDERRWYRYHHLFGDLLRNLAGTRQRDQLAELHRRASRWYAEADMPDEAIRHALAGADNAAAVGLLESYATGMIVQGRMKTVSGWLKAIPPEHRAQSPRANLAFAWMHLLQGNYAYAAPYVERLQAMLPGSRLSADRSLEAEWLALQSYLRVARGQATEGLALAHQALTAAPEQDGYALSLAHNALGCAYLLMDDYVQAVEAYQQAIVYGRAAGNPVLEMLAAAILAQVAIQHGQLRLAFQVASKAIDRYEQGAERHGSLPPSFTVTYEALAQVHYQRSQLDEARAQILRALRLCSLGEYGDLEAYHRVGLSRLLQREGNLEAAGQEIQMALDRLRSGGPAWVREEAIAQQVRLCLARDDLAMAEAALRQQGGVLPDQTAGDVSTAADIFPVPQDVRITYSMGRLANGAVRVCLYQGRARHQPERLRYGIRLADTLINKGLQAQFIPVALEALLLRSQLHVALGNSQSSLADCATALALAEPEGFVGVFLDEGAAVADCIATLLDRHLHGTVQSDYIGRILSAFGTMGTSGPHAPGRNAQGATTRPFLSEPAALIEPLTGRELEILHLIADGYSNQEIAGRLVLSLHTVKRHISNIFAKLGVSSRTQALARVRQLRILPG